MDKQIGSPIGFMYKSNLVFGNTISAVPSLIALGLLVSIVLLTASLGISIDRNSAARFYLEIGS